MKLRVILNFAALLALLLAALPILAQDGFTEDEQELIATVTEALDQLYALDSYAFEATQTIEQDITAPVGSENRVLTEMVQNMEGEITMRDDGVASRQLLQQTMNMEITGQGSANQELTMEFVIVDGVVYVNITEASGAGAEQFPQGWINLNEDPALLPGAELYDVEALTEGISTMLPLIELNEDTVASITAEPPETIDGREFQVIAIEWNTPGYLEQAEDMLDALLNLEALGLNSEAFMDELFSGLTISQRLWIDVETGYIHQFEQTQKLDIELSAEATNSFAMEMRQTVTTTMALSDFNATFTIEAPTE